QGQRAGRAHFVPELADCLHKEGTAGAQGGFGLASGELHDRLLPQKPGHVARGLRAGELEECVHAGLRETQGNGGVAAREAEGNRYLVARATGYYWRTPHDDGALLGDENVFHVEGVGSCPAHAARAPRIEQLDLVARYQEVARFRLAVGLLPDFAV